MTAAVLALASLLSSRAIAAKTDALTPGVVAVLANGDTPDAPVILRRALTDSSPLVRRVAARVISVRYPDVVDALQQALETERDSYVTAEFVKDVFAIMGGRALPIVESATTRAGASAVLEVADWYARMDAEGFASHLNEWAKTPLVENQLSRAVRLAIACHPDKRDVILTVWRSVASPAAARSTEQDVPNSDPTVVLMTPPGLAARVLRDTLTTTGCRPRNAFMGAMIAFAPDGRPRAAEVVGQDTTSGCRTAVLATARISLPDGEDPARRPHELLIPTSKDFLSCTAEPSEYPIVPGHGIGDPRLKKEVRPQYTFEAMRAKLEGVVETDAVISASGCVSYLRITHRLIGLDVQAIAAILQWRFAPAMLDGMAVPALVSIELTFMLRQ